jgi:hypothetical protein
MVQKIIPSVAIEENDNPTWFDDETFEAYKNKSWLREK